MNDECGAVVSCFILPPSSLILSFGSRLYFRWMGPNSFFEFREQVTRKRREPAGPPTPGAARAAGGEPLTVSQLTSQITRLLREGLRQQVFGKGEISNYSSRH